NVNATPFLGALYPAFATQINNRGEIIGYSSGRTAWVLTPEGGTPKVKVSLSGTVKDDGFPSGASLKTTWTKVSGPGAITFVDASQAKTTAVITETGTYILRLTADDSTASTFDEMTIVVTGANKAPTVNAGPDKTVNVSGSVSIGALVT